MGILSDDKTEMYKVKKTSEYKGVCYLEKNKRYIAQRWSKTGKKLCINGTYKDEKTAAQASDTLARKLMANGEVHQLNFPDSSTEVHKKRNSKRKRPKEELKQPKISCLFRK